MHNSEYSILEELKEISASPKKKKTLSKSREPIKDSSDDQDLSVDFAELVQRKN